MGHIMSRWGNTNFLAGTFFIRIVFQNIAQLSDRKLLQKSVCINLD